MTTAHESNAEAAYVDMDGRHAAEHDGPTESDFQRRQFLEQRHRRDPGTAAIPIIALTAMAMKEHEEKTKLAGCDAYIAKPLRYQQLNDAIDTLLVKGQMQAP